MQEQHIQCLNCGEGETVRQDNPRTKGNWPAWTVGIQPFKCPKCSEELVWAIEPTEAKQ